MLERCSVLAARMEQDIWRDVKRSELQQFNATLAKGLAGLAECLKKRQVQRNVTPSKVSEMGANSLV